MWSIAAAAWRQAAACWCPYGIADNFASFVSGDLDRLLAHLA
jgi:hypothetical protein